MGQGDSTLIVTSSNKKILIDTGEEGALDYLLDRKVFYLNYFIISHFDSDHCGDAENILNSIKVEKLLIAKQLETTPEFEEIIKSAKKHRVQIITCQMGDMITIDKNTKIEILWPDNENIITSENPSNNNALVAKMTYKNIAILFTGDIEELAEKEILKNQKQNLQSTILKVAHHGSKTSTTQEFLSSVEPKIALIGVGKNNKFGHPNEETIEKLNLINTKIYRTDMMGEIILRINKKGRILVNIHNLVH